MNAEVLAPKLKQLKQLKQQTEFARLHFVVYINTTYANTYKPMGLPKRGYTILPPALDRHKSLGQSQK